MATTLDHPSRTIHLPTQEPIQGPETVRPSIRKGLRLSDLRSGETARVLRVAFPDSGCRKRFAELGLAEGMKLTVLTAGDNMMLSIGAGGGSRMGLAQRCAEEIFVSRIPG